MPPTAAASRIVRTMLDAGQISRVDEATGLLRTLEATCPHDGGRASVRRLSRELGGPVTEVVMRCNSCFRDFVASPGALFLSGGPARASSAPRSTPTTAAKTSPTSVAKTAAKAGSKASPKQAAKTSAKKSAKTSAKASKTAPKSATKRPAAKAAKRASGAKTAKAAKAAQATRSARGPKSAKTAKSSARR